MRKWILGAASGALMALSACGGSGDDALGDNAAEAADAKAETLEAASENATNETQSDALEDQAEVVKDAGEQREEAIDDSDVNAGALTEAQKNAVVNGQ